MSYNAEGLFLPQPSMVLVGDLIVDEISRGASRCFCKQELFTGKM